MINIKENFLIIFVFIAFVLGYWAGKKTAPSAQTIRYVKGETIVERVAVEIPYRVEIPAQPIYIYKTDTLENRIVQSVDTAAIIDDWVVSRNYRQHLFDNQQGKLSIEASVQYNRLQDLRYSFTPIEKQIELSRTPLWLFYVGTSYNTLGYAGAGGGVFYRNWGLGLQSVTNFEQKGFQVDFKYKF